jgi:thiol-disulfide isomerase/thioredoxin
MSKPRVSRAQPDPRKTVKPRGAKRGASRRRWRVWVTGAAVLLAVAASIAVASAGGSNSTVTKATPAAALAPDGGFATTSGTKQTVSSLRGQPTLLWFVTTWCSSCQAGTQAMASQIATFAAHHVRVVELELANDLGQPGPSITAFGRQLAGAGYHNPDWTFGVASTGLTTTYDPTGYLDIYYLLDASGHVAYTNSSPAATIGPLLSAVAKLATRT